MEGFMKIFIRGVGWATNISLTKAKDRCTSYASQKDKGWSGQWVKG